MTMPLCVVPTGSLASRLLAARCLPVPGPRSWSQRLAPTDRTRSGKAEGPFARREEGSGDAGSRDEPRVDCGGGVVGNARPGAEPGCSLGEAVPCGVREADRGVRRVRAPALGLRDADALAVSARRPRRLRARANPRGLGGPV